MTYRFGVFEFDDRVATLTRSDRRVPLEPQPARALALLLSRAGDLVRRDELIAHLWGSDTHVDFDRGLAYCVGQLRTALGPSRIGVNGNSKVLRNPRADRDPRTVARETHASFLVAGHLQTKDGRLSLLMHIIRLDDGTHVWVQRISRSPDEGLESLDEDVAAQIEQAVRRIVLKDGLQAS
jgi:hypothetical protein